MWYVELFPLLVSLVDEAPEPEDVVAGWVAFGIFLGLAVAVALLGFSLTKHLRRAADSEKAGLFDSPDRPRTDRTPES